MSTTPQSIQLVSHPIDFTASLERVRSTQAGAVILFLGTVREMTNGRQTCALDYEAYPDMARQQMHTLLAEACQRWPVTRVEMIHRLGRLELGEVSISIALSCPHRAEAFAAGQYLIDRFKETVPIWKKENWVDGSTEWVHPGTEIPQAPQPTA